MWGRWGGRSSCSCCFSGTTLRMSSCNRVGGMWLSHTLRSDTVELIRVSKCEDCKEKEKAHLTKLK